MKVLAIIPARGGSKRLPGKNTKHLLGKPLISWTLDLVKDIEEVCDYLVSTDDQTIAKIANDHGSLVPWLRPNHLATDDAKSIDVILHALNWYEEKIQKVDGVLMLQPTSPFRTKKTINDSIKLLNNRYCDAVISVSSAPSHPQWVFKLQNKLLAPFIMGDGINIRSQDLEPAYVLNGSLYLATPDFLRKNKSFYGKNTMPIIIESKYEAIDIDTSEDFELAEYLHRKYLK
jgi:CMP-N,N'-diacetyllegionaminic acid synthase